MSNVKGRDTSILLFMVASSIITGILVSHQLTKDSHIGLPSNVVSISLIVLLVIVTAMMIFVYHKRDDNSFVVYVTEDHGQRNALQRMKYKFPIIGLYIFGTGSVILDVLTIIFELECVHYVGKRSPDVLYKSWHGDSVKSWVSFFSSLLFHVSKIIFFVIQMAFLLQFSSAKFFRPMLTRLIIAISLCANCAVWVVSYLQEMEEIDHIFDDVEIKYGVAFQAGSAEHQVEYNSCLNQSTTLGKSLDEAAKYLYPFTMEYSLVAIGILYHLWTTARADDTQGTPAENPNPIPLEGADVRPNGQSVAHDNATTHTATGNTAQHSPGTDGSENVIPQTEILASNQGNLHPTNQASVNNDSGLNGGPVHIVLVPNETTPLLTPSVTNQHIQNQIGIIFNFGYVFIILNFIVEVLLYDKDILNTIVYVHYGFQITFYMILIFVSIKCLSIIRKNGILDHGYDEEDILLLLSSSGTLLLYTFTAIAGWNMIATGYPSEHTHDNLTVPLTWIVTLDAITNFVQVAVQNRLIIRTMRFKPSSQMSNGNKKFLFNSIMFVLLSNLSLWALDSFIELQSIDSFPLQHRYFGASWKFIVLITYPLAIFYRFHSVGVLFKHIP